MSLRRLIGIFECLTTRMFQVWVIWFSTFWLIYNVFFTSLWISLWSGSFFSFSSFVSCRFLIVQSVIQWGGASLRHSLFQFWVFTRVLCFCLWHSGHHSVWLTLGQSSHFIKHVIAFRESLLSSPLCGIPHSALLALDLHTFRA